MAETPAAALTEKVGAFLGILEAAEQDRAVFEFDDTERWHWVYVPEPRLGLPVMDMNGAQREAGMAVLRTALSTSGFETVSLIQKLEGVLRVQEGDDGRRRNPDKYYFSIFGEVGGTTPWGLRFEGHHISLQWTVLGDKVIASTPQFFGTNPAEVLEGAMKGTRVLGAIEDEARALIKALKPAQRAVAMVSERAPRDILSGIEKQAVIGARRGLAFGELGVAERARVMAIIEALAGAQRRELAEQRLAQVRQGDMDKVTFSWMGGLEPGEAHYFCIQGDAFLIEYDNVQNQANHVHLVWRIAPASRRT
jgi:hypothetical protein